MKITELKKTASPGMVCVSARIDWEDSDRGTADLFFSTTDEYVDEFLCNPHAFLTVAVPLAMRYGEKRLAIDSNICPELRAGLEDIMEMFSLWSAGKLQPVKIEAGSLIQNTQTKSTRTGLYLSGGVDSMFSLRRNRLDYSENYPGYIKDCVFVHGADIGGMDRPDQRLEFYERYRSALEPLAQEMGVNIIPIYTNARRIDHNNDFWLYQYHGAVLGGIAHTLSSRIGNMYIASTYDVKNMKPFGSHPLVDPRFGSADLRIYHDGLRFSRLEKTRLVSEWPTGMKNLRVCTGSEGPLNCGRCEKCIRTKTALLAIGVLDEAESFRDKEVTVDLLSTIELQFDYQRSCYEDVIAPLEERGYLDLASYIKKMIKRYYTVKKIKDVDNKLLRGSLAKMNRLRHRILTNNSMALET